MRNDTDISIEPENGLPAEIRRELPDEDIGLLQAIYGYDGFRPTILQVRTLIAYMRSDGSKSIPQVCRAIAGGDYSTWYHWRTDPAYNRWWKACLESAMTDHLLSRVHLAMARRALKDSPTDTKTYLERFDPAYKPASSLTVDTGFTPGTAAGSRNRQAQHTAIDTDASTATGKS